MKSQNWLETPLFCEIFGLAESDGIGVNLSRFFEFVGYFTVLSRLETQSGKAKIGRFLHAPTLKPENRVFEGATALRGFVRLASNSRCGLSSRL